MMSAKKFHQYRDQHFGVARTSLHSASVQLICGKHEHEEFLIQLTDEGSRQWVSDNSDARESDWAIGRETQGYPVNGDFRDAVENAADLLLEECSAMTGIEAFFGDGGDMTTTDKALVYQDRQYVVTNKGSVAAEVNILCDRHDHRYYIVGLVEDQAAGWILGRPDAGSPRYAHEGAFVGAVENAANLLLRECISMDELDEFFRGA